jgi:hypothetical protein
VSCARGFECTECHRHFGGLSGFDAHRINTTGQPGYDASYDWTCASDQQLQARGLRQDGRGLWIQEARFQSRPGASRSRRGAA